MILTIAIPTFNRLEELKFNLNSLCEMILKENLEKKVKILISDNASETDITELIVETKNDYESIVVKLHKNKENIGSTKNIMNMLDLCNTQYIMLLGDDDYIDIKYLKEVVSHISDSTISCILPSYYNVDEEGKKNGRGRDVGKHTKRFHAGFYNCFVNSWRAHQLSGIVLKKDHLFEECIEKKIQNLYLQIYLVSRCCMSGDTMHITEYPVRVTRPPQQKKTWGYGNDGLLPSIYDNYMKLREINFIQRFILECKITYMHYWRIAMYLKKGFIPFLNCIWCISKSPTTSYLMKVAIWPLVPIIFLFQSLKLLFTGSFFKTLKTKVDI